MRRIVCSMIVSVLLLSSAFASEEIIGKGELLTLERCIEIALKMQPNLMAARSAADASRSRIGQAQSGYYPQVDFSAGYSRISAAAGRASGAVTQPVFSSNDSFDQYTSSATLRQLLYDFGKTSSQVEIQRLNHESSLFDYENTSQQIIFGVRQSYYQVLQTMKNRDVAVETVRQTERHLEQTKGFYAVGIRPRFDVTRAEVELSNARLSLIRADNDLKVAQANLNNAMGVPRAPEYLIEDNLAFRKYEISFEEALNAAYENRPDVKSSVARRQAAETTIERIKKDYFPVITGSAGYSWAGESFPLEDGWNVGVGLTLPVFSGFLTKYQVEEARGNLGVSRANEDSLKQIVFLEVKQAYLLMQDAEEGIPTAELSVRQATENLEIANGRYAAGVGNVIEVTDAEVTYSDARRAFNNALYLHKVAIAGLQKAMGIK